MTVKIKKGQKLVFRRFNGVKAQGTYQRREAHVNGAYLQVRVDGRKDPLKIREGQVLSIDGLPVT